MVKIIGDDNAGVILLAAAADQRAADRYDR